MSPESRLSPPATPGLVERTRLLAALDASPVPPIALIVAPAGFGKSTLLAEWARRRPAPTAWVTLDAGDESRARQALESLADNTAIVLDDFHMVTSHTVHLEVVRLARHLPPNARILIATRDRLNGPFERLRLEGLVRELDADDLRLDPGEIEALLRSSGTSEPTPELVRHLHARTDGWPAAVRLAARSGRLPNADDVLAGYFAEEVLGSLDDQLRRFALDTSALDPPLTAELCDATRGTSDSGEQLERLRRAQIIVADESVAGGSRYRPLFGELLQRLLAQSDPSRAHELERRALSWHLDRGELPRAIEYALALGDHDAALALIVRAADDVLMRGERDTLWRWITSLPHDVARGSPLVSLYAAWVVISRDMGASADPWLPPAEAIARLDDEARAVADCLAALIESRRAARVSDIATVRDQALRAHEVMPQNRLFLRTNVASCLQMAYRFSGDTRAGDLAVAEYRVLSAWNGQPAEATSARSMLALLHLMRGHFHESAEIARESVRLAEQRSGPSAPDAAMGHQVLGYLCYEWNELPEARRHLETAIALALPSRHRGVLSGSYRVLSDVLQALGDHDEAFATYRRLHALANGSHTPWSRDYHDAIEALLHLRAGDLAFAGRWHRRHRLRVDDILREDPLRLHERVLEYGVLARVLLATGEAADVRRLMAAFLRAAEAAGRGWFVVSHLALLARAESALGNDEAARALVRRALTLAEPEGYVRAFIDAGSPLLPVLRDMVPPTVSEAYGARVLAAFDGRDDAEPPRLSVRERDVLALLATGASNAAIAQQLSLSLSTVKTHLDRTYRKLGARSRTQALAEARRYRLL